MLATDNINDLGVAKEFVTFYNPDNPELSFLHLMLTKLPYWSIGHIDRGLYKMQIPIIEVDNANIYSIMTNTVAPRLGLIFIFDYLNRTVNAYGKENLDFDTNIFIGYRNLAKNVDISVDEDSVYTRFRVRGENDLTTTIVNFGDDQCFDLSYFMAEPYMDQSLIDKINKWLAFREYYRKPSLIEWHK